MATRVTPLAWMVERFFWSAERARLQNGHHSPR